MNYNKLGRGLSSLIPEGCYFEEEFEKDIFTNDKRQDFHHNSENEYLDLSMDLIVSNTNQPRKIFDDNTIQELAQSIKSNGVIQPIIVRKLHGKNLYEIISGERRWRASKIAGLSKIPVIVKEVDDRTFLEISIIENIQREDINSIEEAEAYKKLIDDFSYTHEDIAVMVGKSRTYITNSIRVLNLPLVVQNMIKNKDLSVGHAKIIVNLKNAEEIAKLVVEKSLSVRQTEALIKNLNESDKVKVDKPKQEKNEDLILLEEKISENLGMCVKIKDNNSIGTVCINFRNLEELNIILRKLS